MRLAPLLLGVGVGLFAVLLAWTRGSERREPARAVAAQGEAGGATGAPLSAGAAPGEVALAYPRVQAPPATTDDLDALRARELVLPVAGFDRGSLRDDFADARKGHAHEALDMLAPRGTPVLAADDGFVAKLFTSVRGGLTVYQFDRTQTYCYYYAHLDGYAPGLREGALLRKGSLLGYVGTTGNAPPQTPHLHFAIFRLGAEKRWWEGTPVNPFPVLAGRP